MNNQTTNKQQKSSTKTYKGPYESNNNRKRRSKYSHISNLPHRCLHDPNSTLNELNPIRRLNYYTSKLIPNQHEHHSARNSVLQNPVTTSTWTTYPSCSTGRNNQDEDEDEGEDEDEDDE